ncbi:hypothetical protein [Microlunatus sp. Gsoil 973]|uniref:hypothetical protein n=1 Tax=Microlunatus sp. Gsoil 973 TaxID=2672569 RepID=UPI0012B4CFBD|nr:hypothetical protein [Microlunatus sp. Gsoil 973]QGN33039.1 hypothetical protein GJV80_09695 [Microlunatus sp. Gsoil 973]
MIAVTGRATWLAVLLLAAAAITGILAVRTLLARRREVERRHREAADRDRSIAEAVDTADRIRSASRQVVQQTADQLDRILALLGRPDSVTDHSAGLIGSQSR